MTFFILGLLVGWLVGAVMMASVIGGERSPSKGHW